MTDDQILEVVQAHKDGKKIQCRSQLSNDARGWEVIASPVWSFDRNDYRVAPEPRKPREWWVKLSKDGEICHSLISFVNAGPCIRVREVLD